MQANNTSWVLLHPVALGMLVAKPLKDNADDPLQCAVGIHVASFALSHVELLCRLCCCTVAGKAWQTPLGRYAPQQGGDSAPGGAAWAAVLQLPLEGLLSKGGGVQFVVKRAQGAQPEWLSGPDNKDFFISLDQVGHHATLVTQCAHTTVLHLQQ